MLSQATLDNGDSELLEQMFEQAPGFMALLEGSDYRFRFANLAFCHAFGKRDLTGKSVAEALPWLAAQGFVDMLDHLKTRDDIERLIWKPCAQVGTPFKTQVRESVAILCPLQSASVYVYTQHRICNFSKQGSAIARTATKVRHTHAASKLPRKRISWDVLVFSDF